jgi:hypothetical protein
MLSIILPGIPNEIISLQLDITEEEVEKAIEKITKEQEELIAQGSLASGAASSSDTNSLSHQPHLYGWSFLVGMNVRCYYMI